MIVGFEEGQQRRGAEIPPVTGHLDGAELK